MKLQLIKKKHSDLLFTFSVIIFISSMVWFIVFGGLEEFSSILIPLILLIPVFLFSFGDKYLVKENDV